MKTIGDIPIIGKQYHFFDDGKISRSRHYIALIVDVIKYDDIDEKTKNIWEKEKNQCDWLYAQSTDYFIKAYIKGYDDNIICFVRTVDNGWFSIDIDFWQSGRLDIDNSIYKKNIEYLL